MKYLQGLRVDWESGHGEVKLDPEFLEANGLLKADILKDWIDALQVEYAKATDQFFKELETGGNRDQMQVAAMRKIAEFMDEELEAALIDKTIDEDKT